MSANPVARPQSRRAFIGALAALPAISTPAASSEETADAELLAWADRLDALRKEEQELKPSHEAAYRRWTDAVEALSLTADYHELSDDRRHEEYRRLAYETGWAGHPGEDLEDEIGPLEMKLVDTKPATLAGVVAKARMVAWFFLKAEDFTEAPNVLDWEKRAMRSLVESLRSLTGFDIHALAAVAFPRDHGRA